MNRAAVLVAITILLTLPASSSARNDVFLRGFADAGLTVFPASQSFGAILGTPAGPVVGGGVEIDVTKFSVRGPAVPPKNFFFSLGASHFRRTGHRVFVFQNQVFKLNVSDTVTVTPLQFSFGYRLGRPGRLRPYAGGGIGWYRFGETSADSTSGDNASETHTGYHLLAGAEKPVHKWMAAAVDAQWSLVPHAIGDAATSVGRFYNERGLGGFTVRARIIVGH